MDQYFNQLNKFLFSLLTKDEILNNSMWGENSQFIRINNSKIRQTGIVKDLSYSMQLIANKKQVSYSSTITGILDTDQSTLKSILNKLRLDITQVPEDPFIVYPQTTNCSEEKHKGELIPFEDSIKMLMPVMQGTDLTGLWASGLIYTGVANSLGQTHWFETETFSLDYSLITKNQKMVKDCFAGTHWNQKEYENYITSSKKKLNLMEKDAIKIDPGKYKTYIAPAGVSDIIDMFSWGGMSEASLQQKDSALLKMRNENVKLSPCFTLEEDFSSGMVPRFNSQGEIAPENLPLIMKGTLKNTLVSTRTEKEYGIKTNYASEGESLRSPRVGLGNLQEDQILKTINNGVYLSNLHYLNWSDRLGGRITGMTRYACFYVENGDIVAPIENMRFDDTIYNIFGDELNSVTSFEQLIPDVGTYDGRNFGGNYCPGILLNNFSLTL
ncbi:MAG: Zn-dependent protease [Candidatus Marinimicrobia bacterium]|nr:Zn-dependent protease [Candidatus Neomarinimicrobiota bacterium]|tara:strand:- start:655 stop:1977 length:1323 start_codon:yes stop_codon:yes gene_type:complete